MKAFWRIVYLTPNPLNGARFAVAALVEVDGMVRVAAAKRMPCETCLGGDHFLWSVRAVVNGLSEEATPGYARTIARMPESAGPHFSLGEERGVPSAVADPVSWLRDFVLPGGDRP